MIANTAVKKVILVGEENEQKRHSLKGLLKIQIKLLIAGFQRLQNILRTSSLCERRRTFIREIVVP